MTKIKKHINDKFYTKTEVVKLLLNQIRLSEFDLIIEPSAGNGSFYNLIEHENKIGLDIDPENINIIKQNWIEYILDKQYNNILVIGNPPFGNQGAMALNFIKKCDELCINTIAFILPKSFKKDSIKNRIPTNYHLIKEINLEDNSFTLLNKNYSVPSVFQIWVRKYEKRILDKSKTTSDLIKFVKKNENPDYAIRRVGFYAGFVYDDVNKSEQSHYFVKSSPTIKEIIKNIKWEHNNTAGPRSLGKAELIQRLETIYNV
jgi:predicted RNA methylase